MLLKSSLAFIAIAGIVGSVVSSFGMLKIVDNSQPFSMFSFIVFCIGLYSSLVYLASPSMVVTFAICCHLTSGLRSIIRSKIYQIQGKDLQNLKTSIACNIS